MKRLIVLLVLVSIVASCEKVDLVSRGDVNIENSQWLKGKIEIT